MTAPAPAQPRDGGRFVPGVRDPAAELGPRPKFAWLPIERLTVDERYQRRITGDGLNAINKIVRNFHWSKFQPLTVSGPDASGDYPVIDGQHRLEACRRHPAITEVPCWIVEASRIAEQAIAFVGINKGRIAVTRINVFWASLAAGEPDAVWLQRVTQRAGVAIGKVGTGVQPAGTTVALASLLKVRPLGEDAIVNGLRVIAEAQAGVENAFRAPVILAVVRMMAQHADKLDRTRLVAVLADLDLSDEIEKARVYRKTFGGVIEAALQVILIRQYNKGARAGARLPETIGTGEASDDE
ncbi:MAG: DUF6551 family protein [Ferrovibrionaceae bacterium]